MGLPFNYVYWLKNESLSCYTRDENYCKIHGRYIISGLQENVYLAICEMKPLHYQKSHCIVYGFRRKDGYIAIVEMSLSHCHCKYHVSSSKNVALDCFIF